MFKPICSSEALADHLGHEDWLIFDCRHDLFRLDYGRSAHKAAHIPGAHFLHLDEDLSGEIIPGETGRHPLPSMEAFRDLMAQYGLTPSTTVVAYDDKGGGIAARLWWMLRWLGHEKVAVLDGGIPAWKAAGLPLEDGLVERPTPAPPYPASTPARPTVDRETVDELAQAGDATVVDSRTAVRYRGEHEPIDPVAGHIPGAENFPWPENLGEEGLFLDRELLKSRFAPLGNEAARTVFYCGSGVTACHNILAYYYANGEMPLLYPGSWSEYLLSLDGA